MVKRDTRKKKYCKECHKETWWKYTFSDMTMSGMNWRCIKCGDEEE